MQKVIQPIILLFDGFFIALIQGCSSVSLQSEEASYCKRWNGPAIAEEKLNLLSGIS